MPRRGRHGGAGASSTPSWPAGSPASSGWGSAPWSRTSWATGSRRATAPPTGPPGHCLPSGWSTPPSTSRSCWSCATRSRRSCAGQGKLDWAHEEFEAVRLAPAALARTDPWRRTSGIHRLRNRRQLAAVRALWEVRDQMARGRDIAPGRILPDAAIISAVTAAPTTPQELMALPVFGGRSTKRHVDTWWGALQDAACAARGRAASHLPGRRRPAGGQPLGRARPGRRQAAGPRPRCGHRDRRGAADAGREPGLS